MRVASLPGLRHDRLLQQGEQGEIVYGGPHTMTGYLHDAEATERGFAHGWLHSGDAGIRLRRHSVGIDDRRKDVIKSGGENVGSIKVEKAVYAADENVAEAVVAGLPHDRIDRPAAAATGDPTV